MNVDKSTRYHRLRRRADLAGTALAGLLLLALSMSGAANWLRDVAMGLSVAVLPQALSQVATVVLLTAAVVLLLQVAEWPVAFYQGFLLEHRYGLSTQSGAHWLADQVKAGALAVVLAVAGASWVFFTLRLSWEWWWALSAGGFAMALITLARLAPVLLLPLFYRFRPLNRPELSARLLALATRAGADVVGVFEWVLSGHTKKANAALAGLGRSRRILLSDTLLADYSDDEIEVVLAHELAHHVHRDLWRGMAVQALVLLGGFFVASIVLRRAVGPLELDSLSDPAALPVLMLAGGVWSFLAVPVVNAFSRAQERAADRYALQATRNPQAFITAMRRLGQQNMAEEHPGTLVQWLFYSHPPIRERIAEAQAFAQVGGHQ